MPITPLLREMRPEDVPAVLAVQEPAAVAGLSDVFPQDLHPFPRQTIADRWLAEIDDPDTSCFVIVQHGRVVGFAAVRGDEVMHFGVALEQWGTGVAADAQAEVVEVMRAAGVERPWLRVYAGNARGRRFWERLGWRPTGERGRGTLPPYAELLTYELAG